MSRSNVVKGIKATSKEVEDDIINISPCLHNDLIETLERVAIILEDNKKIKDDGDFYTGENLMWECLELLEYLKGDK